MTEFSTTIRVLVIVLGGIEAIRRIRNPGVFISYRLTVDVDVDGVTHSGSGIIHVAYEALIERSIGGFLSARMRGFRGTVKGYAITVDLGDRGLLFVVGSSTLKVAAHNDGSVLGGTTLAELPFYACRSIFPRPDQRAPTNGTAGEIRARARMIQKAKKEPISIAAVDVPMMVRFTDISNRRSVEIVDPQDLAATFGAGVRLAGVTFELARGRVTPMPSVWPNWLKVDKGGPITLRQPQDFGVALGSGTTALKKS